MRGALALAALLGSVACGGEARKLGEVDESGLGDFGGFGGFGAGAAGGAPSALGGSGGSGENVSVGTGGTGSFDGGKIALTEDQKNQIISSACAGFLTEAETIPILLGLVVDVSGSMNEPAPDGSGLSKWELTRDALLEAVVGVTSPGLGPGVAVSLLLYPRSGGVSPELACADTTGWVPPAQLGPVGSAQRTLIEERLRSAVPGGVSPTLEAYAHALDFGPLATFLPGRQYMMLVTDGTPTGLDCVDPNAELPAVDWQPIVQELSDANQVHGVKTLVVGTAGSEANRTWLSEAAVQGGISPPGCDVALGNCHIDLTTPTDLKASLTGGLSGIVGSQVSCTFSLPQPPAGVALDVSQISVLLSSATGSWLLVRDTSGDCTTGWQFENQEILLCPDSCAEARDASVQVLFGCNPPAR